jgi:membrane protein implicated in regulation of membrane protease activity
LKKEEMFGRLKLIVIIALVIGMVGAVSFLIYGFTFMWQAMAATMMSILLAIMAVFFILLSIYLWIKNFMIKREYKRVEEENERLRRNLKNCNKKVRESKSSE